MIGFEEEVARDQSRADEGPDTRNLEKKNIYENLVALYYLPPYASRGITREYLIKVHKGLVFRVTHSELRHFEVDLTPAQVKKYGVVNNGLLVKKLNILQESREEPNLGFTHCEPPDQVCCDNKELASSSCKVHRQVKSHRVLREDSPT